MPHPSLSEAVRQQLHDAMKRKNLTQRDVAGLLEWSQSRVGKILSGAISLQVDDLDALCDAVGLSPLDAVRDHGLQFVAELTPLELRVLERFRALKDTPLQDAVLTVLQVHRTTSTSQRYAHRPPAMKAALRRPRPKAAKARVSKS